MAFAGHGDLKEHSSSCDGFYGTCEACAAKWCCEPTGEPLSEWGAPPKAVTTKTIAEPTLK